MAKVDPIQKALGAVGKHAKAAKELDTRAHAARATRDQAIRAAKEAGAAATQIADAAGMNPGTVRSVLKRGPFGRERL